MPESRVEQSLPLPPPEAVRAALDRLCASAPLRTSPQLTAFLRYVVEAVLAGHADTVKAYTIAIDALGRPDNFDPVTDAIVRVEARRLRRALAHYYDGEGVRDPIAIAMQPGSYVPTIGWRIAAGDALSLPTRKPRASRTSDLDAHLAYCETIISEGQSTLVRRHLLLARCHRDMAAMWHSVARLQIEIEGSKTVVARSRSLVEHSRKRRQALAG